MTGSVFIAADVVPAGHLGVGSAQVVRPDLVRDTRWQAPCEPAVIRGRDPVQLRIVVWDEGSRALENLPECYRPVSDRQRASGRAASPARPAPPERTRAGAAARCRSSSTSSIRQLAANTSPRRASSTASTTSSPTPPRPASASALARTRQRERLQRRDADQRDAPRPRQRPRRRDPDPQPRERPGSDADGDAIDVVPADPGALEHHARSAAAAGSRGRAARRAVGRRAPCRRRRRRPTARPWSRGVAVSNARILIGASIVTTRRSPPACSITTRAASARQARDRRDRVLRPLDERDPVGAEVVGQQVRILAPQIRDAVQVEVRDGHARRVALTDRERRAGDDAVDPERAAGAADERGLAGAELSLDQHDVARPRASRRAPRRAPRSARALARLVVAVTSAHANVEKPDGPIAPSGSVPSAARMSALAPRISRVMFDRLQSNATSRSCRGCGGSDTAKAAGLAGAMVANNVIALGSVIVFSRAAHRLRIAGRAGQLLPDPRRRRVRDAAGDRPRGRARSPRGRGRPGRDDPELDQVAAGVHGGDDRRSPSCSGIRSPRRSASSSNGERRSGSRPVAST